MARALSIFLVLVLLILAFSQFIRRTGMFYPDRYPTGEWNVSHLEIQPSEHTFTTRDGVKLHAWFFEARERDAPVLLWFHGNAGNLTNRATMAVGLARRGVSVFVFDYRGFGKSEGRASESKLFDDSLAAFDYVRGLGAKRIVLYGESVGGPYAAFVAKERKELIRAVIIENSFPSLRELGNALYAPLPLGWTAPFAMRTTDWLNEAGKPVLVMHGTADRVIPYALGRKLYDGLRVTKELMTCEEAGHCEIPVTEPARYYEAVIRFSRQ